MADVPQTNFPFARRRRLRSAATAAAAAGLIGTLAGCVVAPVGPGYYDAAPGAVYVAPAYPSPGYGWVWVQHPRYGWGWRHPHRGWHRGWR
jgi:hypothetical protein